MTRSTTQAKVHASYRGDATRPQTRKTAKQLLLVNRISNITLSLVIVRKLCGRAFERISQMELYMLMKNIPLSNIDLARVKRDAKENSRYQKVKYCEALNNIANVFGYQTFDNLRSAVIAEKKTTPKTKLASVNPELEELLTWFRTRFTLKKNYESRVSPVIARSLKYYERSSSRSAIPPVFVDEEIDFGYKYTEFKVSRHPQALEAENILEAEGEWVSNAFLDSLFIRQGGLLGDMPDVHEVVGDRITISAIYEENA